MNRASFPLLSVTLLLLPSCAQFWTEQQVAEKEAAWQSSTDALKQYQAELEAENNVLRRQVVDLEVDLQRARAATAQEAVAVLDRDFEDLRQRLESYVAGSADVQYLAGPDGLVVRISDHVLFPSGSAKVSEAGAGLLEKLAGSLAENGQGFRVEGHTDNQPLKVQAKTYPHGNLELSAARAIEVALTLVGFGLPADAVSVAGYGEWRPVADNGTAEGRARNRRVEIVVVTGDDSGR